MKKLLETDSTLVKDASRKQLLIKVCMHVRGQARTDVRVMREATALLEAGYDVTIVDVEADPTLPLEEEIQGVCVKHIIVPSWFAPTRFKPWFLVKAAQMVIHSTFRLMQVPADIYHAHDETALTACHIAARLRHKPLIFDAHELPLFQWPLSEMSIRHRWLRAIMLRLLAHMVPLCAGVITVSLPIAQEIRNHYHILKVSLIRNIPTYQTVSKSDRLRQHLGLSSETRIALYQGGFNSNRGLEQLVRAARFLESNTTIVLMGKGDRATELQLEALIKSEGVANCVKIIPPVPYAELLDWTASADIGLIVYSPNYSPNVRMCLPNKLFEYLMAGLPVLASPLDAIAEIIKTYDCGRVVSSLASADIAHAINTMLADRSALAYMGTKALEATEHDLQWEKESQVLVHLYHDILGAQNGERGVQNRSVNK